MRAAFGKFDNEGREKGNIAVQFRTWCASIPKRQLADEDTHRWWQSIFILLFIKLLKLHALF